MAEIPRFTSEDEERDFWATHDSVDFLEGTEQVNLEYVGREREFTLLSLSESESVHTGSVYVLFESEWVAMEQYQGKPPEWKHVDIELGMASS